MPGTPPSVYIGSYDEHFYALDVRSGKQRWRYDVGGRDRPHGLHLELQDPRRDRIDVRSHRKTFELKQAGYTPMVSDGRRLYLIGYYELIGLQPTQP